jgi:GAF domain-containing protein
VELTWLLPAARIPARANEVSLPLIGDREKIVGVISVHRPTPWIGEADIESLRSVAEFAAAAIIRHHQNAKELQ